MPNSAGLASSIGNSVNSTFDLSSLSVKQIIALIGLVMIGVLAWRQVINFITTEI